MVYVYNTKFIYIVQVHIIIHSNNIIMVYETATTTATGIRYHYNWLYNKISFIAYTKI